MPALPFDPDNPPAQPPTKCDDDLTWRLAYQIFRDHRSDADGFCITCVPGEFNPCVGRHLALRGFLAACRLPDVLASLEQP